MFFLLDSPQNRPSSHNTPLSANTPLPHSPLSSFFFAPYCSRNTGTASPYLALSGSIRAQNRPISLPLNTGSGSPMCSLRCAHTARNAALSRPLGLNTGSKSPYFAIAQYGLWLTYVRTSLRAYGSQCQPFHAPCSLGSVRQIIGLWLSKPSCALRKMQLAR